MAPPHSVFQILHQNCATFNNAIIYRKIILWYWSQNSSTSTASMTSDSIDSRSSASRQQTSGSSSQSSSKSRRLKKNGNPEMATKSGLDRLSALGKLTCENPPELKNRKQEKAVTKASKQKAAAEGDETKPTAPIQGKAKSTKKSDFFSKKMEVLTKKMLTKMIVEATSSQVTRMFTPIHSWELLHWRKLQLPRQKSS